jgi:TfoX/Sxy family transcriptional regulator of competence genes
MASKKSIVDLIMFSLSDAGDITAKKMFGDYGLFLSGRMIGFIADDRLLFKPTSEGRRLFTSLTEDTPYPGAKPCFLVPEEDWNKRAWLARLAIATAAELPLPKKKLKKSRRNA